MTADELEALAKQCENNVVTFGDDNFGKLLSALVLNLPRLIEALRVSNTMDEDWLEEIISDSLEMDWHPRDAARLIMQRLATRPAPTGEPVADKTHHCTGCKERQDRIDELEAQLAEADKHSVRIEKLLLSSAEQGALKLAPEGHVIITQDELAAMIAQSAAMKAAGDGLKRYPHHKSGCAPMSGPSQECTCGLDEALVAWSAANGH